MRVSEFGTKCKLLYPFSSLYQEISFSNGQPDGRRRCGNLHHVNLHLRKQVKDDELACGLCAMKIVLKRTKWMLFGSIIVVPRPALKLAKYKDDRKSAQLAKAQNIDSTHQHRQLWPAAVSLTGFHGSSDPHFHDKDVWKSRCGDG